MKIVLMGTPVPQLRMRHVSRGSFVSTYDPKAKEKKAIRQQLSLLKPDKYSYPRVSFMFYMPIPKGIPKKMISLYESETFKHEKKPDVDNLIKLYLDCMDGIILHGDQKVSLGPCNKVYSKNPRTVIWVNETSSILGPHELDCIFLSSEEPDIPSFSETAYQRDWCILGKKVHSQSLGNLILSNATESLVEKPGILSPQE